MLQREISCSCDVADPQMVDSLRTIAGGSVQAISRRAESLSEPTRAGTDMRGLMVNVCSLNYRFSCEEKTGPIPNK